MTSRENDSFKKEASQRAKARWSILRSALLSEATTKSSTTNKHSIHRYSFQMLKRKIITGDYSILHHSASDDVDMYDYIEYKVPVAGTIAKNVSIHDLCIYTRERKMNDCVTTEELMSHQKFGVDNTGNKRVWDCSNILTYLIMGSSASQPPKDYQPIIDSMKHRFPHKDPFIGLDNVLSLSQPCKYNPARKVLKVLELGAGMAALPSLSLIALHEKNRKEQNDTLPEINVTITDGHPNAVSNNLSCFQLSKSICNWDNDSNVHFQRLMWKGNDEGAKECLDMLHATSSKERFNDHFDLCLVSDCVHFTDFHVDLTITIARTLRIGGKCLLLQPPRGQSLQKFLALIDAINEGIGDGNPLFEMNVHDYYSDEVYQRHCVATKHEDYDSNIHYPVLLVLEKLREYNECLDSNSARNHCKCV